jgi:hypothetical protein
MHIGEKGPNHAFMTYCHRELFHAQWEILLDDEFLEAYMHGIVITCCDGIQRRFYPRIFTYSADYPEKYIIHVALPVIALTITCRILIATIRNLGSCPCPRCCIPMSRVPNLGMVLDMKQRSTLARVDDNRRIRLVRAARNIIYNLNKPVYGSAVDALLKGESLVPTSVGCIVGEVPNSVAHVHVQNAFSNFSQKLEGSRINWFGMLVVDLLHEFELGVWKALFIHLLRILDSVDPSLIVELDRR